MPVEKNAIFENPDFRNFLNSLFNNSSELSKIIYLSILCILIFTGIGMYLLKIPVYVESRGIIRPSASVMQILAPVPGLVNNICVSENQFIEKGGLIIQFDTDKESLQKILIENELQDIHLRVGDLKSILNQDKKVSKFLTKKYSTEYRIFEEQLNNINLRLELAKRDNDRFGNLVDENFISPKEYEESELKYRSLITEKKQLLSGKEQQWINELSELTIKERILIKQLTETEFYIRKSNITAPFSGIIQGIRNIYPGEYFSAGKDICRLVPDTCLEAEMFLSPGNIGMIKTGQNVRLLIDSYDYKYWGVIKATCQSISEDIEKIETQVLFRVICRFDSNQKLEYQNRFVTPGKGMTLTAQFMVTEKNIWQLLRDKLFISLSE